MTDYRNRTFAEIAVGETVSATHALTATDLEPARARDRGGNMLAKQLHYLAGADSAGIVLGARVPIVLTLRADPVRSRMASTAVMKLVAQARLAPISA